MSEAPIFGQVEPGHEYRRRPSAYCIAIDDRGQVAVVRTPRGFYLPGGGLEAGEDAEAAVVRECLEECGFEPRNLSHLGSAVQLLIAPGEGAYRIEGEFYTAQASDECVEPQLRSYEWTPPSRACDLLTRPFERWAIRTWQARD